MIKSLDCIHTSSVSNLNLLAFALTVVPERVVPAAKRAAAAQFEREKDNTTTFGLLVRGSNKGIVASVGQTNQKLSIALCLLPPTTTMAT